MNRFLTLFLVIASAVITVSAQTEDDLKRYFEGLKTRSTRRRSQGARGLFRCAAEIISV